MQIRVSCGQSAEQSRRKVVSPSLGVLVYSLHERAEVTSAEAVTPVSRTCVVAQTRASNASRSGVSATSTWRSELMTVMKRVEKGPSTSLRWLRFGSAPSTGEKTTASDPAGRVP